jgi:CubicO group peptidase (beta-lactamase class C family)
VSAESRSAPSVLAAYHVSADETTREISGSLPSDMRFPVASVTKTLTALLAARLFVDGIVAWDVPLAASGDTPSPVSLRTLLSHTAGLPFELHPDHWGTTSLSEPELSSTLAHPPRLQLPPGTCHYSNLGYALAARILEDVAGQTYPALLTKRLLRPLGMTRTSLPDEQTEGPVVLGAAAPAGDLWSTLDDLMTLARAIDGRRPGVVTWPMLVKLLELTIPDHSGAHFGAGIRTHRVGYHSVLVTTGTVRNRTTCITVWPRRGTSVLVAEAGQSHDSLWRAATLRWRRDDTPARTWWWDGQAVIELHHGDKVELLLSQTTWPFPLFSGRAKGQTLIGVDWCGRPLELLDQGDSLIGAGTRLTADVADSAHTSFDRRLRAVGNVEGDRTWGI